MADYRRPHNLSVSCQVHGAKHLCQQGFVAHFTATTLYIHTAIRRKQGVSIPGAAGFWGVRLKVMHAKNDCWHLPCKACTCPGIELLCKRHDFKPVIAGLWVPHYIMRCCGDMHASVSSHSAAPQGGVLECQIFLQGISSSASVCTKWTTAHCASSN